MKPLDETVEAVMRALGLDDAAVVRRKAFLEFTDDDVARLKALHEALQDLAPDFANAFYAHLLTFEETRALLPDAQMLERLKRTQAAYFDSLTAGDYGPEYIHHRLRVGVAHQRVGLAPEWYIGAYSKYLAGLLPEIWQRLGKDPGLCRYRAVARQNRPAGHGTRHRHLYQADRQTILTLRSMPTSCSPASPMDYWCSPPISPFCP